MGDALFFQLLIGAGLVCLTIFVTVGFIGVATVLLNRYGKRFAVHQSIMSRMVAICIVTLWLLAALTIAVWIWAAAFIVLGQFETLEEAVYFSVVSFTTLGFGDVVIGKDWRILSGIIAANGLILFSLVTAFLIEFIVRLRDASGDAE